LLPPLIITDAEANRIVETLGESVSAAVREAGWDQA
jgi:adenosylmethionine-8-amino-7-oxononanoate aminotransferase